MVNLYVALLAASMLWIFGSLPWLTLNYWLCIPTPSIACLHPTDYRQHALMVITFDILLIAVGTLCALQIRNFDGQSKGRRRSRR